MSAVQTGATAVKGRLMQTAAVSVFLGNGSVLTTDRRAPESSLSIFCLALFHFSPSTSVCAHLSHPRVAILFLTFCFLKFLDVAVAAV